MSNDMRKFIEASAGQKANKRTVWNKILAMVADADQKGMVEDIGQKKDSVHGIFHEFMIDGETFKIVREE